MFDHNSRGSTPPPGAFDYEQSHSVLYSIDAGFTCKHFSLENVIFKDPAADGVNHAGTGTTEKFTALGCKGFDRTRTRSDIQFSTMPLEVIISDYVGHSIETENLVALSQDTTVSISNCIIEKLDWAMDSPAGEEYGKLFLDNVRTTDYAYLGTCSIKASNCDLTVPEDGRWNNIRTGTTFSDTKIRLPYDDTTGAVTSFYPLASTADHEIEFNGCEFIIDSLTVPVTPTGFLIQDAGAFSVANSALYTRKRIFNNCTFDPRAEFSVDCYRNGTWQFNDCKWGGTDYVIRWLSATNTYLDVTINGGDFTEVTGDFLSGSWAVRDQVTTVGWLRLRGDFYGAGATGLQTSAGTITDAWGLENTRRIDTSSVPTEGLLNDTILLNNAVFGTGNRYSCTTPSATGGAVFRVSGQCGVVKDTTANRVSPTANDIGLTYMDTTLDADGHMIWWNGAAWVDAQGLVV
jgi:hypothetical protein